jgi:uncharacterized protein (TIGR03086 family)
MTDPVEALTVVFDYGTRIVGGISADQLTDPSPCRDWDVAAVFTHMCGVIEGMGSAASGTVVHPLADYRLDPEFHDQYARETRRTLAAWSQCDLTQVIELGPGPGPALVGLNINLLDTSTHLWDLARATDNPERLPDDIAETILEVARTIVTDEGRSAVGFDPEISLGAGSTPIDRLVAFLGRQP